MVETLTIPARNTENLVWEFPTEKDYDRVITADTDLYRQTPDGVNDESNIIFKYRKNVFSTEEIVEAYEGLIKAAKETKNRGAAAGPRSDEKLGNYEVVKGVHLAIMNAILDAPESSLDENFDVIDDAIAKFRDDHDKLSFVWSKEKIIKEGHDPREFFDQWLETVRPLSVSDRKKEAKHLMKTYISDTTYANIVYSGIAGWFDRYDRTPYGRATAYTESNPDLFAKSFPYLQTLSKKFAELLPVRYGRQKAFTDKIDPKFVVPGTCYTTITVNKTFQTACHRDAGDLSEGFSNITCLSKDATKTWEGCLFVLPEYRVAIELHPGDLLLVNNHEGIHGNTELTSGERVSVVAYAREKMSKLGSFEYETLRKQYVDDRRKNPDHPLQRWMWNGVSPGMWNEEEWFQYLEFHGGEAMREKYHPKSEPAPTLDSFF